MIMCSCLGGLPTGTESVHELLVVDGVAVGHQVYAIVLAFLHRAIFGVIARCMMGPVIVS